MPIVEHNVIVRGPIEDVFDLSQSPQFRRDWDRSVRSQRPLDGADSAAQGVRTETISRHRLRMVTEHLTFRRPTLVGTKMVDGPPIFSDFSESWRFADRDDGRVDVAFRYDFTCHPSWLAVVMDPIGTWYFGRDIERRVEAFRQACDDSDLLDRVRAARPVEITEPLPQIPPIVTIDWLEQCSSSTGATGARGAPGRPRDVVVCDVRSTMSGADPMADYLTGHIPGATFVPLEGALSAPAAGSDGRHPLPSPTEFAEALGAHGIGDDTTVIAYDDRGGAFAARLVWMLRVLGSRAALLDGGLGAWKGELADGPEEVVTVSRTPIDWPTDAIADAARVTEQLVSGRAVVDSRDAARYAGEVEPIDKVAGHIPGAINLPFTHNLGPDSRFRPIDELADRFRGAAVDGGAIVYCGSGVTACHNALAVEHAGLGLPTVYVGSWSGWSHDPHRPVGTLHKPA